MGKVVKDISWLLEYLSIYKRNNAMKMKVLESRSKEHILNDEIMFGSKR